ncbi:MAG: hypothetical protein ACKVP7_20240 [Hyphomicrobiaceae bacterium]
MTVRRAFKHGLCGLVAAGGLALGLGAAVPAVAELPFAGLNGNWKGNGQIRLANGSTEALKCVAYYTPKDSGASVGLAIRCASASNKIELRANLVFQGGRISGTWEERVFNAAGEVTGQTTGNRMTLAIAGGGFSGSMAVSTTGSSQTVSITTDGIGLKGVNISLSKG